MHPVTGAVMALLGIATVVISTWMTIVAFVGGTMPIIGLESDGGLGNGLFWLFIVDPIVLTVAYWIAMAVAMALTAVLGPRD